DAVRIRTDGRACAEPRARRIGDAMRFGVLGAGWHAACHASRMDIANPIYGIRKRRRLRLMVGGAALALPAADRSSLWIDAVQQGDMLREVRATGTLVPREIRWLAAATPATVEKILVWPGTTVQPDTVLMRLSDPATEDALRNAQAQVAAAQAQVAAKRAELESQLLDQRSAQAQAQSDYASAKVKADADAIAAKE